MPARLLIALVAAVLGLVLAAPAGAETITGTFHYLDRGIDKDGNAFRTVHRPIAFADVEVWSCAPGALGCHRDVATRTNASGSVSVTTANPIGTQYRVRVFATNDAAMVKPKVAFPGTQFYEELATVVGGETALVTSAAQTLEFSRDFDDFWSAAHFNIADVLLSGRQYALAHRHPQETDPISHVSVLPTSTWAGVSFFNRFSHELVIKDNVVFDDFTLLHEYAHFLQEQISHFAGMPSEHDGCFAKELGSGRLINSPEHAWMEGFANYFASAVMQSLPTGRTEGFVDLESIATQCDVARELFPGDAIELVVSEVLWDLIDGVGGLDTVSGRETDIFHIFDHELDTAFQPTLEDFRSAWLGLKLPAEGIGRNFSFNGVAFRRNHPPIADAGANVDVREGRNVTLDGSGSEEPELETLEFAWTQTGGPGVTLATADPAMPTFTAPLVGPAGATLTFRLVASESGGGLSATDFVQVIVRDDPAWGELSPLTLDFGPRRAGVKVTQAVTLTNIGPGVLDVGTRHVAGSTAFGLEGTTCGLQLRPTASCTFTIGFTPPPAGSVQGTFVVATPNSPDPSLQIQLRGEGGTPAAELDKGSLDFGPVLVGASWTETIRLSNTGPVPVAVASVTSWGGEGFTHSSCPATIVVGGSCLVTVTFRPTTAGPRGAWLRIDDDGGGPRYLELRGSGVPVGRPAAAPGALAFGTLGVGAASGTATVGISNVGGAPLFVSGVAISGHFADFELVSNPCRGVLLQPSSPACVVQVRFTPQAGGPRTAALTFDTFSGPATTSLTGTGVAKPGQTAWRQFGFGAARGGFNAAEHGIDTVSVASLATQWELDLGTAVRSSPAIVDGVAYVGGEDGRVRAVDLATRTVLWSAETGGPVRSSPAVVDGVAFVGSDDGSLYALDAATGDVLWTFATRGPIRSAPAVKDGVVLVASLDGNLYALDAVGGARDEKDRRPLWWDEIGPVHAAPAVDGTVAYAAGGNRVRAYELATGNELWTSFVNAAGLSAVTVADGRVHVSSDGGVHALHATSGSALWSAGSGPASSPSAAAYGIVFAGIDGQVAAHLASDGAPIWHASAGPSPAAVAIANGVAYITVDGRLVAVDAWTGLELAAVGLSPQSSPVVVDGVVYVGTDAGIAALAP